MNSKVKLINIKEDMPPVDIAIFILEREIKLSKLEGYVVLKVIHGYGSHGAGGSIKKAVRVFLKGQKRLGLIKNYIPGEGWSSYKVVPLGLLQDAPELLLNLDSESFNLGMTIVVL